MKLIKKFNEGKYSGYQIKQMVSGSFSVYYGKELVKSGLKTIDDCYQAMKISEARFSILEKNMIQCAIQAYREVEEHTACECKDIGNLDLYIRTGKKCGHCEMVDIFTKKILSIMS